MLLLYLFSNVILATTGHLVVSHELEEKKPLLLNTTSSDDATNNVLLISFDGFRWDYFDLVDTPHLNSIKNNGVHAEHIKNVIPTSTFPNHASLATGLYPESHGFVKNSFYDPVLKDTFNMSIIDPKFWWNEQIEPIWFTNEKQGGVSGVCYWPGYNIDGYKPTYMADPDGNYVIPYHDHGNSMPYKERVDNVITWLQQEKPPNFLMMYFGDLDEAGHHHGAGTEQVITEITRLDNITGYLLDQLSKHDLLDKWNIIITSDHGMTNLSLERTVDIADYINLTDVNIISGAVTHVWPINTTTQVLYKKLKNAHPNMTVYLKEDVPPYYHYKFNRRIPPIVIIMDDGWRLLTRPNQTTDLHHPGSHGFSNKFPSMWPLFLAQGPAFKRDYVSTSFNNVDIYSMMCKLLGITARPNNGSLLIVNNMLIESHSIPKSWQPWNPVYIGISATLGFVLFGILVFSVAMCCSLKNRGKVRRNTYKTNVIMNESEQANKLLDDYEDDENCEVVEYDKQNEPI